MKLGVPCPLLLVSPVEMPFFDGHGGHGERL